MIAFYSTTLRYSRRPAALTFQLALVLALIASVEVSPAASLSFSNTSPIILAGGPAIPFPSQIVVSDVPGLITKITVNLTGLTHTYPSDIDALLVGPGGQRVLLLSDAGAGHSITNVALGFDDSVATQLSSTAPIPSGVYRPTDYEPGDILTNPAPPGPYGTALSAFTNSNPNGTWSLFLFDDFPAADGGSLAGGWSVTLHYDFQVTDAPREDWWVTDGPINAMAQQNGILYLGGRFTSLRPNRGTGIALDLGTLAPHFDFPQVNGDILAVAPDQAGGFFIGGDFTRVGDQFRTNLAYVGPDRRVSPWSPAVNGRVLGLAWANGVVYAGGEFTSAGGQTRNRLAALDGATGGATAWNPNANDIVSELVIAQNTIYVAGSFTLLSSQVRAGLAAVDFEGNGPLLPWNPNPQGGVVLALTTVGGTVFVGGTFTNIGGQVRNRLAALDAETGLATAWTAGSNSVITSIAALAAWGNRLYVGGEFLQIGGANRRSLAALEIATGAATSWDPNPLGGARIDALAVTRNKVFVGGSFTNIGGQARDNFAALATTTNMAQPWGIQPFGNAHRIAISAQTILAAGPVLANGRVLRQNAAALDLLTGQPAAWNPGVNGEVWSLLADGNSIYIGGSFLSVGGQSISNLALVRSDSGAVSNAFAPAPNGSVFALAKSAGGQLLVGGGFGQIGGQPRSFIAALNSSGLVTTWNPSANGVVRVLTPGSNSVYVGGSFTVIGGQPRTNLAALFESTGAATAWSPNPDSDVRAIAVLGSNVFVAGGFTNIGGTARRGVAAVNSNGMASSWNAVVNGDVLALAPADGHLYFGGSFSSVANKVRHHLAAVSITNSSILLGWNPDLDAPTATVVAAPGAIFAGGEFTQAGLQYRPELAAFPLQTAPRVLAQPDPVSVFPGLPAFFSVTSTGQPPVTFQWRLNGSNVPGATSVTLALSNAQIAQAGDYSVVVSNLAGRVVSRDARLTVLAQPVVLGSPQSQMVAAGTNVALSVTTTGSPPPQIVWHRNGYLIPGAVGPVLQLENVQPSGGGVYGAVVFNGAGGTATTNAILTVATNSHLFADSVGNLTLLPSGFSGTRIGNNVGATKELLEPAHAGDPGGASVWCAWQAPQAGLATFDTRGSTFDTLLAVYLPDSNLTNLILWGEDDDSGEFGASRVSFPVSAGQQFWIAIDGYAGRTGNIALNWSLQTGVTSWPRILKQSGSVRVLPGANATFSVLATNLGSGVPGGLTYQWFHGARRIPGATNSSFTIPNAQGRDLGWYSVTVVNSAGQEFTQKPMALSLGVLPGNAQDFLDSKLSGISAHAIPISFGGNIVPTSGSYSTNASVSFAVVRFQPSFLPGTGEPIIRFIPLPSDCGWLLMREDPQKNYSTFTNDTGQQVALLARTEGNAANTLSVYRNEGEDLVRHRVICRRTEVPDYSAVVTFAAAPGTLHTVVFDPMAGAEAECYLTNYVLDCSRPLIVGVQFGEADATLEFVPVTSECRSSYQWVSNGVVLPGETGSTLSRPYPLAPATYAVVVSNWVGFVTNVVADFLRLEITRESAAGPWKLTSVPDAPRLVYIEATTNLAEAPPVWFPFHTNAAADTLSLALPTEVISNIFFRARPLRSD